jgi:hypothetical protein
MTIDLGFHACAARRGVPEPNKEKPMETISQMPFLVAALQYSLIYLLLGGGFVGAIGIFVVAKLLGK